MSTRGNTKNRAGRHLFGNMRMLRENRGMTLVEVSIAFVLLMILLAIFSHCIQISSDLQNRALEQNQMQDMRELAEYYSRNNRTLQDQTSVMYDFGEFELEVPQATYYMDTEDVSDVFYLYGNVD